MADVIKVSILARVRDRRDFAQPAHEDEQVAALVGRVLLVDELQDAHVGRWVQLLRGTLLDRRDRVVLQLDRVEATGYLAK